MDFGSVSGKLGVALVESIDKFDDSEAVDGGSMWRMRRGSRCAKFQVDWLSGFGDMVDSKG